MLVLISAPGALPRACAECGGKMHLAEELWSEAYQDFFEAFKNYDEAGHPRRLNCLKLLVLANMLMKSKIDPFTAQEVRAIFLPP